MRVLIVCACFVVMLSVAAFVSVQMIANAPTNEVKSAHGAASRAFFALPDGKNCRHVLFDRDTSDIIESVTSLCEGVARAPVARSPNARSRSEFSWDAK